MAFQNIAGRLVDVIFGYDFFVSYTWADGSKYAHSLYEKLKAQGFTVFLDEKEYARGDNWTLLGRRALKKTRQLILVATPKVHAANRAVLIGFMGVLVRELIFVSFYACASC
jgi:TIR domain